MTGIYDYCLGCPPTHPATVTSRRRSCWFEGSPIDLYFPRLIVSSVSFKNATNPTYSPTNILLSIEYSANKNHGIQHVCVHNLSRFVEFYDMFQVSRSKDISKKKLIFRRVSFAPRNRQPFIWKAIWKGYLTSLHWNKNRSARPFCPVRETQLLGIPTCTSRDL